MLDTARVIEIAETIARRTIAANFERVFAQPTSDSQGKDALRITVVLKPQGAERVTGDEAIDLLVGIQRSLDAEGDERFPIVEYATEAELLEDDEEDQQDEEEVEPNEDGA